MALKHSIAAGGETEPANIESEDLENSSVFIALRPRSRAMSLDSALPPQPLATVGAQHLPSVGSAHLSLFLW
eukprot:m.202004 g.202004  ORF g.202004 m.202004 type:complete len:72 (-) comp15354_c0_seq9:64-279(-)